MKKSKYGMPPPNTRLGFEHNIFLTIEMAQRKIENEQFDYGFLNLTLPHLQKLKSTPNNRIDLNSVDEQLRLESNMLYWEELITPLSLFDGGFGL